MNTDTTRDDEYHDYLVTFEFDDVIEIIGYGTSEDDAVESAEEQLSEMRGLIDLLDPEVVAVEQEET